MREQEVILNRPTWWEWTQLDEWGYSDNLGAGCSRYIQEEQIEYPDIERMGLSDSEGETHSEVDHGEESSSDYTVYIRTSHSPNRERKAFPGQRYMYKFCF